MARAEQNLKSILDGKFDPKELPWYEHDLSEIPQPAKKILESKIPPAEVLEHVKKVFPYPCIGAFRFLDMSVVQSPVYAEILHRLKSGEKLLDVGCAVGQELRQLVFDGVPSENLYASDLRQDFFDIGYDLFNDHDSLKSQFIMADIFDDNSDLVKALSNGINIVNAASFFHLFDWDRQVTIAKRLIGLLHDQPGSLLVGRQVGRVDPPPPEKKNEAGYRYRHDPSTWKKLWEQVGAETGTEWEVEAWMEKWDGAGSMEKTFNGGLEAFKLRFTLRRI
ncbi:uncharacterized protein N7511_009605 [Penicillium nucicola]|uniref:uncharacterized protein n=1 Tax=Penicillium nucicola TaxID=1850975 RepID=UPI0025458C88|nr:uncharacterized protein N7511_009605 [Penicillium nucicola]KAJ5747909.1 hypothetical protein N7511_009605 [Penicillium nucicola]